MRGLIRGAQIKTALILCCITAMTLMGDYCIKLATGKIGGLLSVQFIVGALLYGITAIGWFFLMKDNSLAIIGVLFSASTVILLAALGTFVFKEPFGWREAAGIFLAVLAVVVISHK